MIIYDIVNTVKYMVYGFKFDNKLILVYTKSIQIIYLSYNNMVEKMIGIKELHRNLKNISDEAVLGGSFIVIKNSKPVFRIVPLEGEDKAQKYSLQDLKNLQFESKEKSFSKDIDNIMY